jgi:GTP-binding protein HflX
MIHVQVIETSIEEIVELKSKNVILVTYPDDFSQQEGRSLVESVDDNRVVKIFSQKYLGHSTYGLGSGKVEEIKEFLTENKLEKVVVDDHMTSKRLYNLEKATGLKVIDRERLILDIFYSRATTTEAKLQIQLAEIKYELPRVREEAKLAIGSERPGRGGSGEYVVDVKFRDLKRRMGFIADKLSNAQHKRQLYQKQRASNEMPIVALVGYTSSGKTTLFNLLTHENKETSDSLFTTLSTTTRSFIIDSQKLLLTDTVGFISRLPTYMIEAFKSTLEESLMADVILLLIDSSQPVNEIRIKYSSCWHILDELRVDREKVFVIFTKCDNAEQVLIQEIATDLGMSNPIATSAKTGYGIHKLKNLIAQRISQRNSSKKIKIPA